MSQENVEILRGAVAAFNAHDIEGWVKYYDREFEFVDHMGAVAEEAGSGIEAVRLQVEGWFEAFPDFRAEVEEFINVGGDRIVSVTHWQGTGSGSGLPYSQHAAEMFTFRGGKIVRAELGFADKDAALEAAGQRE
jgi:ketosteroid isomerase-like protein